MRLSSGNTANVLPARPLRGTRCLASCGPAGARYGIWLRIALASVRFCPDARFERDTRLHVSRSTCAGLIRVLLSTERQPRPQFNACNLQC